MNRQRYKSVLAEALWRRNLWMAVAVTMAVSNAALAYWVVTTDVREKTIITPPVVNKAFWVRGEEFSPEYLEQMAVFFAGLALTYNPDNVHHQAALFLRYADPTAYGALAARLEGDAEKIKRSRMSSAFYPQEVRIRDQKVALTGQLVTLVGGKITSERQATFLIGFARRNGQLFVKTFVEVDNRENPFDVGGGAGPR